MRLSWGIAAIGLGLLAAGAARAEDRVLYFYNWADYMGRRTIPDFAARTGIRVVYDTYDSSAEEEAKLMAGGAAYDVVTASTSYFARQITAGVYRELDKSKLPHWKNLDPAILARLTPFDPGNAHAVPFLFGTNGFAYDVDKIRARMPDAPVDSLDMLFKPEIVAKFADCGVTLVDSQEDVLEMALRYLHLNPNSTRAEDYQKAEALLMAIRPYVRAFDSAQFLNDLPNGEVCLAMAWSADFATARARAEAAGIDAHLAFTIPKEGANEWFDALLIPRAAPHPDDAYRFVDYLLEPEVIAAVTNEIHYANSNLAAAAFVEPRLLQDPAIYPTPEVASRLYESMVVAPATERLQTRIWTRIRTGR
jgi:putrescine transport system substrate-binding protein